MAQPFYAISKGRIDFTNPFPRVTHDHTRIGKEHEERRKEKSCRLRPPMKPSAPFPTSSRQPWEVVLMRAVEDIGRDGHAHE